MTIHSGRFYQKRPPSQFLWLGIFISVAFWPLDSLIDVSFFRNESFIENIIPSGHEFWMRLFVSFLMIAFSFIVFKFAEENNRLSEYIESIGENERKLYSALFDFAPVAIVILSANLRIVKWNKEAAKIFGWNQSDVIGMSIFEIMLPIDGQKNTGSIEGQFMGSGNLIVQNITKNGRNPQWEWYVSPIMNDANKLANVMLMGEREYKISA